MSALTPTTVTWLTYVLGIFPTAIFLLRIARQDDSIPERVHGPLALLLSVFWPALLAGCIGAFLAGIFMLATSHRFWWSLLVIATRPLYSVHLWCLRGYGRAYTRALMKDLVAEAKEEAQRP